MLKRAAVLSFLVFIGIIGTGCASEGSSSGRGGDDRDVRSAGREPDLTGIVSDVEGVGSDDLSPARILVEQRADRQREAPAEEDSDSSKSAAKGERPRLYLNITEQTRILREERDGDVGYLDRVEASELEKDQEVRVWHGEEVSRSHHGQTQAESIVIVRGSG